MAHPGMVQTCKDAFDAVLDDRPNQLDRKREDGAVTAAQLLAVAQTPGGVTEEATQLFLEFVADDFADFLTLPAYERMD